jgi:hypothetical protein
VPLKPHFSNFGGVEVIPLFLGIFRNSLSKQLTVFWKIRHDGLPARVQKRWLHSITELTPPHYFSPAFGWGFLAKYVTDFGHGARHGYWKARMGNRDL